MGQGFTLSLEIGARNMLRNLRRSLITVLSIAFGVAVIMWLQCVLAGSNQNLIDSITRAHIGHLQLYSVGYLPHRPLGQTFPVVPDWLPATLGETARFSPRIHLPILLSTGDASTPVSLVGVEPALEAGAFQTAGRVVKGSYLEAENDNDCSKRQIYLGQALADILQVKVGEKTVVLAQAADGSLGNELLRVKGIFDSGSPDFDRGLAFTTLGCAAKIGAIQGLHEIAIQLPSNQVEAEVRAKLKAQLTPHLQLTTWREAMPLITGVVKYNDASLILVGIMLLVLITLGVINTLLVSVFERTRELGLMIALGTRPGQMITMIVGEAAFIGLISVALGTIIGSLAVLYHQAYGFDIRLLVGDQLAVGNFRFNTLIHPVFDLWPFAKIMMIMLFFMVLAAFIPALRAARLNPVAAIRST